MTIGENHLLYLLRLLITNNITTVKGDGQIVFLVADLSNVNVTFVTSTDASIVSPDHSTNWTTTVKTSKFLIHLQR